MKTNFNLDNFINTFVTKRIDSLMKPDFDQYKIELEKQIEGKGVLVIGGAGTIGSNYIKAILKYSIKKLVVIDTNENGLTELVRDLRSSIDYRLPKYFITYPVNFGDKLFKKILNQYGPFDIVANFAAHKHVRSEKDIYAIEAMIENNVLRIQKLLNILADNPPEHFFCVSTDKAANPVNIMGASKKLMEEVIMAYQAIIPVKTARFANVAFSNGSLPIGFINRLSKNQPLACPIDIKRFFVSPQESGELCLLSSIIGESGDILFPKLDKEKDMISFDQVVFDLLNTLGLKPDICKDEEEAKSKALLLSTSSTSYPIYLFKSDTSGEKSFEEFYTESEQLDLNSFINLGVIKNSKISSVQEIEKVINQFRTLFESKDVTKSKIIKLLKQYIPNFMHIETFKNLDQKM